MKKLNLLFAGAFAAFALVACSKDESEPEPEPEPGTEYDDVYYAEHASISCTDSRFTTTENGGEVHFKAEGGDVQVLVSCGTEWTVSNSNTAAFTVEITDTYYVTITAAQNLADEDLTGTVTLATAEMNIAFASIAVTQDGLGHITLSVEELSFPRTGGEATVTVDANYDWDCEYESDWFTVVADTGAGTLTITCDANGTGEVREGAVTVTAGDGEENVAEATLKITQEDFEAAALVLEYTINEDGTEIQLPLGEKNYDENKYYIDCTVDWGDGSEVETVSSSSPSHTYSAGTYTVIINGTVELLCDYDYDTRHVNKGVECLTAVKQWGDLGLKSMVSAFYYCTNLTSLPEGAGPFSNVTSFSLAFDYCTSLTTVPEDLFSNCTSATDFSYAFFSCESLTTVPEDIFSGCTAAEDFGCVFSDCYKLTSTPSFKGLSNVTSFYGAFHGCESLTAVPEDIFSGCTAVEDFGFALDETSLTTVPENLFADCPSVESFYGVFYECTSLESVPVGIFGNNKSVTDFGSAFFRSSLTTVPENLFANCPLVEYFDRVFYECTSLESVPVGIFDNNKSVERFEYAFYDCPKLSGESPYTMIDEEKVHLYDRENYPEYFTVPTYYEGCFTGCTGLDDYYSIPSSWGGGASPSSITPQSLNATSTEESGPSRLGPQRDAMGPRRDAMTPQGRAARLDSIRK